jgi:hypothetical protein
VRRFLYRVEPRFARILLVESGSRAILEHFISGLLARHGQQTSIDLVTCYAGRPATLPPSGRVYRVTEYPAPERNRLYAELQANSYDVLGIVCSGEPIMTKWKWSLVARISAKPLAINENGDWFWLDRFHWRTIRHFVLFRAGLSGSEAVSTLSRLALFPFTLLYLLLYAAVVHLKRNLRRMIPS